MTEIVELTQVEIEEIAGAADIDPPAASLQEVEYPIIDNNPPA